MRFFTFALLLAQGAHGFSMLRTKSPVIRSVRSLHMSDDVAQRLATAEATVAAQAKRLADMDRYFGKTCGPIFPANIHFLSSLIPYLCDLCSDWNLGQYSYSFIKGVVRSNPRSM